jgi:hypothetical protein
LQFYEAGFGDASNRITKDMIRTLGLAGHSARLPLITRAVIHDSLAGNRENRFSSAHLFRGAVRLAACRKSVPTVMPPVKSPNPRKLDVPGRSVIDL